MKTNSDMVNPVNDLNTTKYISLVKLFHTSILNQHTTFKISTLRLIDLSKHCISGLQSRVVIICSIYCILECLREWLDSTTRSVRLETNLVNRSVNYYL